MKKLALVLSFIALSAHAEVVITGGFGIDGATNQPVPTAHSVKDAAAVYKALNVKLDERDKKVIEIKDGSTFECEKPNSGCQLTLRASQKGKLVRGAKLSATVTFSGELADKILKALPAEAPGRAGATVISAANVSCTKGVFPGAVASCTIKDMNAIQMDVEI